MKMAPGHLMLSRYRYVDLPPLAVPYPRGLHESVSHITITYSILYYIQKKLQGCLRYYLKQLSSYLDEFVGPVVKLLEGRLQVADAAMNQLGRPPRRPAHTQGHKSLSRSILMGSRRVSLIREIQEGLHGRIVYDACRLRVLTLLRSHQPRPWPS